MNRDLSTRTNRHGDLRLELRTRVAEMARWREERGLSQQQAADKIGIKAGTWGGYECMRIYPIASCGGWKPGAVKIAGLIGKAPELIWTSGVLSVTEPKRVIDVDSAELQQAIECTMAVRREALPPAAHIDEEERTEAVEWALSTLSPRDEKVLRMRFYEDMTLEEVAEAFGVSRERVRQIEAHGLRNLRHPSRCKTLKPFVNDMYQEGRV